MFLLSTLFGKSPVSVHLLQQSYPSCSSSFCLWKEFWISPYLSTPLHHLAVPCQSWGPPTLNPFEVIRRKRQSFIAHDQVWMKSSVCQPLDLFYLCLLEFLLHHTPYVHSHYVPRTSMSVETYVAWNIWLLLAQHYCVCMKALPYCAWTKTSTQQSVTWRSVRWRATLQILCVSNCCVDFHTFRAPQAMLGFLL